MGAFTLARLIGLEAFRRPRAVLATVMLALSAGFLILPNPGASYATLTFHNQPLVYTPAVMGVITGGMFVAFSMLLGVLAMSALAPMRAWRAVFGVTAAPSWALAMGVWLAGFGAGLFLLTCIWGGALMRASSVLHASGSWLDGLWIFFTWTYGVGVVGAAFAATVYSVLALRLATRPGLLMGVTFITFIFWVAAFDIAMADSVDIDGQGFALRHLFPGTHRLDLGMGFIGGLRNKVGVHAHAVGDLISTPGGVHFLLMRAGLVVSALLAALLLSGTRVKPLVTRSKNSKRSLGGFLSVLGARFGLAGVIVGRIWSAPFWATALLIAAIVFETLNAGNPISVMALGFAWGLYMLRWPELTEAFEHGALRSLVQPSVLGPWPVRLQIGLNIAIQMSLFALPLIIALAAAGRMHGLTWLGVQIAITPLLCLGLARLRGGATMFSLAVTMWWYLMVSGNATLPAG